MESNREQILELEKQKVKEILDFVRVNQFDKDTKEYEYFKKLLSDLFEIDLSLYEQNFNNKRNVKLSFIENNDIYVLGNFIDCYGSNKIDNIHIITLNELNDTFNNLNSNDLTLRVYGCSEIIRILFHEISHYKKIELIYNSESNDKSLKYVKEKILIESIEKRKLYRRNHDSYLTENQANMESKNKLTRLISKNKHDNFDYIAAYLFSTLEVWNKNKSKRKEVSREDYVNYYIDALLYKSKDNSYYLNRFPILQKEYNMNGIKKSLSELIDNYFKELEDVKNSNLNNNEKNIKIKNTKRMYFDIIYRRLLPIRKEHIILDDEIDALSKDDRILVLLDEIKSEQLRLKKINLGLLDKINIKKKIYDSNLNYVDYNTETVKYYIDGVAFIYDVDEFIELFNLELINNNEDLNDIEKEKSLNFLNKYFFARLPKNGYFILKNGTKLTILNFYEKYIIPNIKELFDLDLNGYISFLKKLVISNNECENIINQDMVERFYLRKISIIDTFKKRIEDVRMREI